MTDGKRGLFVGIRRKSEIGGPIITLMTGSVKSVSYVTRMDLTSFLSWWNFCALDGISWSIQKIDLPDFSKISTNVM